MVKSAEAFTRMHPEIEILWDRRSLREFGEAPIDDLCDRYDFIVVDHPFVGRAHATGCLRDLCEIVPDVVETVARDEVGPSARSYRLAGGMWGLPTDTAAQVAAYRPDLLELCALPVPRTHEDVLRLAHSARKRDLWMAVPACPTDAACLVFTYSANLGRPPGKVPGRFLEPAELVDVLQLLKELVGRAHPESLEWNPIRTYEAMTAGDEIVYVPALFGYSNYSRQGCDPLVLAADLAGPGEDPAAGSLLGGAGCSVTRSCRNPVAAATFLRWLHQPQNLGGIYFEAGGQPGSRRVWMDDAVNQVSNRFFRSTIRTIDQSYLRPRFDGFVPFFERMGIAVNACFRDALGAEDVARRVCENYARTCEAAATIA